LIIGGAFCRKLNRYAKIMKKYCFGSLGSWSEVNFNILMAFTSMTEDSEKGKKKSPEYLKN